MLHIFLLFIFIVMSDLLLENNLLIDSAFRNPNFYDNPFKFKIKFGAIGSSYIQFTKSNEEIAKNADNDPQFFVDTSFNGDPGIKINRTLNRVKYLKLNTLILPISNVITYINDTYEPIIHSVCNQFFNARYLVLKIKGTSNGDLIATDSDFDQESFLLIPDKIIGDHHRIWCIANNTNTFINPINIASIDIELRSNTGEIIQPLFYDQNTKICAPFNVYKTMMDLNGSVETKKIVSIINIYKNLQFAFMLSVGCLEKAVLNK